MNSFFEDACVHISQDNGIAVMQWLGLAKSPEYRQGYEQFLAMLQQAEKPLRYWLFDCTGGKVVNIQDQNWTIANWYEGLAENITHLPKRMAVILSQDIFNKIANRVIMTRIALQAEAELAYFADEEEATDWLAKPAESYESIEELA